MPSRMTKSTIFCAHCYSNHALNSNRLEQTYEPIKSEKLYSTYYTFYDTVV